jgi:hypothetical protein
MKRALMVAAVVGLVALGIVSAYMWRHDSNTTIPGSTGGWTGEYFWETGPAHAPIDAVLLTLLQTPSGVSGTWTETSNNTVLTVSGSVNGSTPVRGSDVTSSSMTLNGTVASPYQLSSANGGLTLTYTPSGGGIQTLSFDRVTSNQSYNQAVTQIREEGFNTGATGNS